jgi:hypothetical protein
MKIKIFHLLLVLHIHSEIYFEISFKPADIQVKEEYLSNIIVNHIIRTPIIYFNHYSIYEILSVIYNDETLQPDSYKINNKNLPGIQFNFNKSGEYLITMIILSVNCNVESLCKVTKKHSLKVDIGKDLRMLDQIIDNGYIFFYIFFVFLVVLIVFLSIRIISNKSLINKWGNNHLTKNEHFSKLDNNPILNNMSISM